MSASEGWRQEGNEAYKQAADPDLSPSQVISSLESALKSYLLAEKCALSEDETASAHKNYARASWKLASIKMVQGDGLQAIHNNLKETFLYSKKSLIHGKAKTNAWREDMENSIKAWLQKATDYYIDETKGTIRARLLEEIAGILPEGVLKGECYLRMGHALFHQGLEDVQNEQYKSCLSLTKDTYFPIEEASRLLKDEKNKSEIDVLREDVFLLTCRAESLQARSIGDDLLDKLMKDEEEFNMTLLYSVIDWYTNAVLLTREKELELEAVALARLGKVYAEALKMKDKAKEYYKRCITLCNTWDTTSSTKKEVYEDASKFIKLCQEEVTEKERTKWEEIRKQYINAVKDDVKKLDKLAAKEDDEKLVRYIYKTYPPKDKRHVIFEGEPPWCSSSKLKAIRQASIHYHPDKVHIEEHGGKVKVLYDEIAKVLNWRLNHYKGVD